MSRRPCHRTQDHPAHLWLQNRQRMECPGVGGGTGIVLVDTNDEALRDRLAEVLAHDLDDEPYWSCVVIAKNILTALREASE